MAFSEVAHIEAHSLSFALNLRHSGQLDADGRENGAGIAASAGGTKRLGDRGDANLSTRAPDSRGGRPSTKVSGRGAGNNNNAPRGGRRDEAEECAEPACEAMVRELAAAAAMHQELAAQHRKLLEQQKDIALDQSEVTADLTELREQNAELQKTLKAHKDKQNMLSNQARAAASEKRRLDHQLQTLQFELRKLNRGSGSSRRGGMMGLFGGDADEDDAAPLEEIVFRSTLREGEETQANTSTERGTKPPVRGHTGRLQKVSTGITLTDADRRRVDKYLEYQERKRRMRGSVGWASGNAARAPGLRPDVSEDDLSLSSMASHVKAWSCCGKEERDAAGCATSDGTEGRLEAVAEVPLLAQPRDVLPPPTSVNCANEGRPRSKRNMRLTMASVGEPPHHERHGGASQTSRTRSRRPLSASAVASPMRYVSNTPPIIHGMHHHHHQQQQQQHRQHHQHQNKQQGTSQHLLPGGRPRPASAHATASRSFSQDRQQRSHQAQPAQNNVSLSSIGRKMAPQAGSRPPWGAHRPGSRAPVLMTTASSSQRDPRTGRGPPPVRGLPKTDAHAVSRPRSKASRKAATAKATSWVAAYKSGPRAPGHASSVGQTKIERRPMSSKTVRALMRHLDRGVE